MANYPIKENPEFNLIARMFETTDRGHADVFNALGELLINNDAFLNAAVNKMIEKGMITHVLGSSSTEQVLGADVGPKITELINAVDNKVAKVNSDLVMKQLWTGVANTVASVQLSDTVDNYDFFIVLGSFNTYQIAKHGMSSLLFSYRANTVIYNDAYTISLYGRTLSITGLDRFWVGAAGTNIGFAAGESEAIRAIYGIKFAQIK